MKILNVFSISLVCSSALMTLSMPTQAQDSSPIQFDDKQKQWVGRPAPQFKLQDQSQKWHELKQYKGQWMVLYFYPKDDSPGCTQEANQFKALYPAFKKSNAVVFGVSLDDVQSHQKFSQKLGLPFPLLSDQQHQLANQLGVVRNLGVMKVAKRESFLIDPNGTIVYHYSSVNTQSHAAEVLNDIQQLKKP
ncbi:peroxiredoxin Q/BCP [Acinetobacter calcoaceticus]|uniref:thioredoxin-dependent peroxiredoxin n=1 Tax=Acinetobacter calcoaceticus TaxID=471 RepID=A0A4R1XZE9_ACICA|nr:peroxiredoxin Q/BCP [Acinetobacter calcoaceticus]